MTATVRFAPSPTGLLHLGNARTALLNWLLARRLGGRFVLRYDDTDAVRSTEAFVQGIAEDLAWLGIKPDQVERQSARKSFHDAAADRLRALGRLYPCYETEEELEYRRRRQIARGQPPVYDRAALKLTADERARLEVEGRRPHWRFRLDHRIVTWQDGVLGPQRVDTASLSDPVLIRADGSYLYTLPSVVDDLDLGISHVVRGADHITNTGVQIEIIEALGGKPPAFAHHNLLTLPSGEGLSKRLGHLSLKALRDEGIEWLAVAALSVLVGTGRPVEAVTSLDDLQALRLDEISHSPAKLDPAELASLNARLLHHTEFDAVADRLSAMDIAGGAAFWLAVRGNLQKLDDARGWWSVANGSVATGEGEPEFLAIAARLLPGEPWDDTTWGNWTNAIKSATGRKGKELFLPLRLALTGLDHGPELRVFLPFIGRERALVRLQSNGSAPIREG